MGKNTVYHYTSPDGAYSILKHKTLWFTDCQYLNDKSEIICIREPLESALRKICLEYNIACDENHMERWVKKLLFSPYQVDEPDYDSWEDPEEAIRNGNSYRYYVLCTSMESDASNMWNYFVKNGSYHGYNFGINKNVIKEIIGYFNTEEKNSGF